MRVLEYSGLDATRVQAAYGKTCAALARGDFRSAEVKKLGELAGRPLYRAKLDHTNRLLFTLVRHGGETCALMLEIILQHAYEKSRFLRGAAVDEDKIAAVEAVEAEHAASSAPSMRYLHPDRHALHFLDRPLSFDDVQEAVLPAVQIRHDMATTTDGSCKQRRACEGPSVFDVMAGGNQNGGSPVAAGESSGRSSKRRCSRRRS